MAPIRILLVDDEQAFVAALAERLAGRGYHTQYVMRSEEALRVLAEDRDIDVLLLDVMLPGMDGLETLRRIKADHPQVETIMLTAHAEVAAAVAAMRMGAREYLIKPCDFADLIAKVEAAAARKSERERKIREVRMRPYISDREREELIAAIWAS
jgi:DNA-binding response OmpR family regulator